MREYSLTTLLCIFLPALLIKRLAPLFCFAGFCCMLAAAAIDNPEAPERKVRFNAEENSLTVFSVVVKRQFFRSTSGNVAASRICSLRAGRGWGIEWFYVVGRTFSCGC